MMKAIWFDMDGTIADLYGVPDWLLKLQAEDASPYTEARPLVNMSALARALHRAQGRGYAIGIISWASKGGSAAYNGAVAQAKVAWLQQHLPSVTWDKVDVVAYGTPKHEGRAGILFDDEQANRMAWGEGAYGVDNILQVIRGLN